MAGYESIDIPGASEGAPAFFLFHGTGGDEHQFTDLAAELNPGARLIGVRGCSISAAASWEPGRSRSSNALKICASI